MAETITIAGKSFPKPLVIAGGFAVVGIVGYAYWNRAMGGGSEEGVLPPDIEVVPNDQIPGASGGTISGTFSPNAQKYESDQEWFNDALEKLVYDFGVADNQIAGDALDRYLKQMPMTEAQQRMIAYVINSIGPPPTGTRSIRTEPPKTTPPGTSTIAAPARVTAATAGKRRARVSWAAVPNAAGYRVRQEDGLDAGKPHGWHNVGKSTSWTGGVLMHHPRDITVAFRVQALGAGGIFGGNRVSNAISIKY